MSALDELPVEPQVTPAFSVAGVLLIISGLVYCLVSSKRRWIQISMSTAYLVALAITVLIIYVADPPVPLAIQGAYLVGVIVPALLLGAISCVFPDITEGLGCALGGFSWSMFLLVLRPGGLLESTASKAIFISCWTAACFGFSLNRYTKPYALIACVSIGGATATVLGIDCFSCAGLKEFWAFIWGLNDSFFPLQNSSYPLTRGIRVEIAGIVILSFVGILAQVKIWRAMRVEKEKRDESDQENERQRDETDAELGLRVTAANTESLRKWESLYGNSDKAWTEIQKDSVYIKDCSVRDCSSDKSSETITQVRAAAKSESASFELEDTSLGLVDGANSSKDSESTSLKGERDPEGVIDCSWPFSSLDSIDGQPRMSRDRDCQKHSIATIQSAPSSVSISPTAEAITTGFSEEPVPSEVSTCGEDVERSSLVASADRSSCHSTLCPRPKSYSNQSLTSIEALHDPNNYDDCQSVSSPLSLNSSAPSSREESETSASSTWQPEETDIEVKVDQLPSSSKRAQPDGITLSPAVLEIEEVKALKKVNTSKILRINGDEEARPAKPMVQIFRTNEWAKHLDRADQPKPDPIRSIEKEEAPTKIDEEALLQTPNTAAPRPFTPARQSISPPPALQYTPGGRAIPGFQSLRCASPALPEYIKDEIQEKSPRCGSPTLRCASRIARQSLRRSKIDLYHSMSPVLSTPISEDEEMSFSTPRLPVMPRETLLSDRSRMLQRRRLTGQPSRAHSQASNDQLLSCSTLRPASTSCLDYLKNRKVVYLDDDSQNLLARQKLLKLQQRASLPDLASQHSNPNASQPRPLHPLEREAAMASLAVAQGPRLTSPPPICVDRSLRQRTMLSHWRAGLAAESARRWSNSTWTGSGVDALPKDSNSSAVEADATVPVTRTSTPVDLNISRSSSPRSPFSETRHHQPSRPASERQVLPPCADTLDQRDERTTANNITHGLRMREVDLAHRRVMQRMQAGANRQLRERETMATANGF